MDDPQELGAIQQLPTTWLMEREDEKCFRDIAALKSEMENVSAITWLTEKVAIKKFSETQC
jgi:hypothetical protein